MKKRAGVASLALGVMFGDDAQSRLLRRSDQVRDQNKDVSYA